MVFLSGRCHTCRARRVKVLAYDQTLAELGLTVTSAILDGRRAARVAKHVAHAPGNPLNVAAWYSSARTYLPKAARGGCVERAFVRKVLRNHTPSLALSAFR